MPETHEVFSLFKGWDEQAESRGQILEKKYPDAVKSFMAKALPKDLPANSAYLGEILVGDGMDINFRVLAAHLIGKHLLIDAEPSLVASLNSSTNPRLVTATLQALIRLETWKLASGISAYSGNFSKELSGLLSFAIDDRLPSRFSVYGDWNLAQLVKVNWSEEQKKLAHTLLSILNDQNSEEPSLDERESASPATGSDGGTSNSSDATAPESKSSGASSTPTAAPDFVLPAQTTPAQKIVLVFNEPTPLKLWPDMSAAEQRAHQTSIAKLAESATPIAQANPTQSFVIVTKQDQPKEIPSLPENLRVAPAAPCAACVNVTLTEPIDQKTLFEKIRTALTPQNSSSSNQHWRQISAKPQVLLAGFSLSPISLLVAGLIALLINRLQPKAANLSRSATGPRDLLAPRVLRTALARQSRSSATIPMPRRRALLLTLAALATFPQASTAAPWTPIQPRDAAENPARFGEKIELSDNDLWNLVAKNLNLKLAELELWKQEAEAGRLSPNWNIELTGGFTGSKPVLGANVSRATPNGTLNLTAIYESKGLTLATDFIGALLRKIRGTTAQSAELQKSLILAVYFRVQEMLVDQYKQAADLLTDLALVDKKIQLLASELTSVNQLIKIVLPAGTKSEAAENRQTRVELQSRAKQIEAKILALKTERANTSGKLLPFVSDSALDAGKPIIPISWSALVAEAQAQAVALLRESDGTKEAAARRNPSLLAATQSHAAAQQAQSLLTKERPMTLNVGSFLKSRKAIESAMHGPILDEFAGMPVGTRTASVNEHGLSIEIPWGGNYTADFASAQAEIAKAKTKTQRARQDFSAEYVNAFETADLLLETRAKQKEALMQLLQTFGGGTQFNRNASLKMRAEQLTYLQMLLTEMAETEASLIRATRTLATLGARAYPWEKQPRKASARRSEFRDLLKLKGTASTDIHRTLAILEEGLRSSAPFTQIKRAHVVDAALLDVNGLTELARSQPQAFWIFLFDSNASEKKSALERQLIHLSGFKGTLIQSENPFVDAAAYLLRNKMTTDSIAVGMDDRLLQLSESSFALRVHANQKFWRGRLRSQQSQIIALRAIFENTPPPSLARGLIEAETYLAKLADTLLQSLTAETRTRTSV